MPLRMRPSRARGCRSGSCALRTTPFLRVVVSRKSPAPSNVRRVLVDGARSAEPPMSHGHVLGDRVEHLADASRPATPLASAGKTGMSLSQPSGSSRCCICISWSASSGCLALYSSNLAYPRVAQLLAARADAVAEVASHAVGHEELLVLGPAVVALRAG